MNTGPIPADMKAATDQFSVEADRIVASFGEALEKQPAPEIIYHYTDGVGFRGIIETGKLWFTDIFSLNDPTELRHGLRSAIKIVQAEAGKGIAEMDVFSNILADLLRGNIERIAHFFVCCFSRDPDELGQWRAYADNGRGFAIGFDGETLERAFAIKEGTPTPGMMIFPMTYEEHELHAMHQRVLDLVRPLVTAIARPSLTDAAMGAYMSQLALDAAVQIIRASLFFKHKAYRQEAEYRFFQLFMEGPVADLKYRGRPYSLVRYREFNWRAVAPHAIKRIVIGPAADDRMAFQFVHDCLREFHPDPAGTINIAASEIPYRASP